MDTGKPREDRIIYRFVRDAAGTGAAREYVDVPYPGDYTLIEASKFLRFLYNQRGISTDCSHGIILVNIPRHLFTSVAKLLLARKYDFSFINFRVEDLRQLIELSSYLSIDEEILVSYCDWYCRTDDCPAMREAILLSIREGYSKIVRTLATNIGCANFQIEWMLECKTLEELNFKIDNNIVIMNYTPLKPVKPTLPTVDKLFCWDDIVPPKPNPELTERIIPAGYESYSSEDDCDLDTDDLESEIEKVREKTGWRL